LTLEFPGQLYVILALPLVEDGGKVIFIKVSERSINLMINSTNNSKRNSEEKAKNS